MRTSPNYMVAGLVGVVAAGFAFFSQSGNSQESAEPIAASQADAVFAGGCFWCTEADFDKVDGVVQTISGYTGGDVANPSYEQVTTGTTGHYESVRVIYDPTVVSYDELVDYYWRTIDPLDARGQFCDKGTSYRTAIFVETDEERATAEEAKAELSESGELSGEIKTEILSQGTFWPAEDYHQDYYKKNKSRYDFYRSRCGRDQRLEQIWGEDAAKKIAANF
ncbi:MAG: peptide-methionine (S)-S-oxide reductase [Ponticaulis sp.]|nr:peptide-methionine (S)-S-oxide reductase [Ponticaulis sp.]